MMFWVIKSNLRKMKNATVFMVALLYVIVVSVKVFYFGAKNTCFYNKKHFTFRSPLFCEATYTNLIHTNVHLKMDFVKNTSIFLYKFSFPNYL